MKSNFNDESMHAKLLKPLMMRIKGDCIIWK